MSNDLSQRLRKRAEIRRSIPRTDAHGRDRISDICEEAAGRIDHLEGALREIRDVTHKSALMLRAIADRALE